MRKFLAMLFILLILPAGFALKQTSIYLPAIRETDQGYEGAVAVLNVEVKEGDGHTYVDTSPLTKIDTQASARIARDVACRLTEVDCSKLDFFYVIRSEAQIVGGPSAGASMAVATLTSLLDLNASKEVVLTGTINPDGTIGPVGRILEKAQATASVNGTQFLVPSGQSVIYYEETETTEVGPVTHVRTTPKRVDIMSYAKEEWGLEVIEVSDVEDALRYYSGHRFKEREGATIDTSKYVEVMKEVSEQLKSDAQRDYQQSREIFQQSGIRKGTSTYTELAGMLQEMEGEMEKLKQLYEGGNYYGASSQAFKISIRTSYVKNALGLLESGDGESFLYELINGIEEKVKDTDDYIDKNVTDNIIDIELIAVSSQRINEADDLIRLAWKNYYNEDYLSACYYASYADERSKTARTWFDMTEVFGGNQSFNTGELEHLAKMKIDEADSSVTYASTVSGGKLLGLSSESLENAMDDYEHQEYASAIINAALAKVQANLAMEVRGLEEFSEKAETAKNEAELSIKDAESVVYPLVAVSYYEYGKSFEDDYNALLYYSYAKEFACVSESIYQVYTGETIQEPIIVPSEIVEPVHRDDRAVVLVAMMGIVAGVVISKSFL